MVCVALENIAQTLACVGRVDEHGILKVVGTC